MRVTITSVDYAPKDLYGQVPFDAELLHMILGSDRPDYWLARLNKSLYWNDNNTNKIITYLVLSARWVGEKFIPGIKDMPINIAYVMDVTVLTDKNLDFAKCHYCAIGVADDAG